MSTPLLYSTTKNAVQKTLDAALLAGATSSVTLNSVVGIQNKAGVFVVDRVDSNGTATPSKREYITFTGVSGSTLTGLTRNADGGGTDQDHAVGAIVEFVSDVLQEQAIIDGLLQTIDTTGALDTTKVVDLTTAQALTNKTLTSPKINEDVALTSTATELNFLNTSVAGTAVASKALVLGSNKNIDTLSIVDGGLKLGAGAGTAVTSTAAELNLLDGYAVLPGLDGWTSANESWSYASSNTINVPSGAASKYKKGDKIKWTQTTVKYGVISAVADTLLTIITNTDYVVTNAAISNNYYSHVENPIGFPQYFTFSPNVTGFSGTPSQTGRYFTEGDKITIIFDCSGTSNATTLTMTLPVAVSLSTTSWARVLDNTSTWYNGLFLVSGTTATFYREVGAIAFTASGTKQVSGAVSKYGF